MCTRREKRESDEFSFSSIYLSFSDRKVIGNTCIAVWRDYGCQNRSTEWWSTRVCVYAVNAMNHLDSFKSDVVNPTPSLPPSLSFSSSFGSVSLCSFGRWDMDGRPVIFIESAKYPSREEVAAAAGSGRDESIRIEAWVYTRCCNVSP